LVIATVRTLTVVTRISRTITFSLIGKTICVELLADGRVFGFLFFVLVEKLFQRGCRQRLKTPDPFPISSGCHDINSGGVTKLPQ
jgi:hypothetical protein